MYTSSYFRDASSSATFILKTEEGDETLKEEWIPYQPLDPNIDEFKFRNEQVSICFVRRVACHPHCRGTCGVYLSLFSMNLCTYI